MFKLILCKECNGEGIVYEMIACGRSMSDCCGGCTRDVKCEHCDGTGEIDNPYYDGEDQ